VLLSVLISFFVVNGKNGASSSGVVRDRPAEERRRRGCRKNKVSREARDRDAGTAGVHDKESGVGRKKSPPPVITCQCSQVP
jgi:hypothetical protein